ncbi:MAG TPA: four-carbon acid sugar kinase family protein [Chitinophagaceae bacterium]|jgi:uncharacterized protein YgbK (DUF1537 family)
MAKQNDLLLAFYGDDFTGSTDALEFLSNAGAKTVLFMKPPGEEQLARYPGLQAIGVAGTSRSMSPENMEKELRPAFTALRALGIPHIHYKVCSTFDAAPHTGSIGKAIDIGAELFPAAFVPVLGGAPALGRYCVFGNLFARMGIGSSGAIYRLDRHPSMSRHPVTPSDESDLRLHLSRQTKKRMGLLDILSLADATGAKKIVQAITGEGAEVVLMDALYEEQMTVIGELIDGYTGKGHSLFSVGSSGIEMALGAWWIKQGRLGGAPNWARPGKASSLLVVSGSRSPVTAGQVARAVSQGFKEIQLDTKSIAVNGGTAGLREKYVASAIALLQQGDSVIIHTGADSDEQAKGIKDRMQAATAEVFGTMLGLIVREVAAQVALKRVVIAGGDTSSYAARALGIEAVEMIAPLWPGAPLCRAYAPGSPADGIEINLKGGQVGSEDYFERAREI